jgi:hypothetical protein
MRVAKVVFLLGICAVVNAQPLQVVQAAETGPDIRQAQAPNQIEPGIFDVPVIVPDPQDSRREEFRRVLHNSERALRTFAQSNGWGDLMTPAFLKQIEVYDSRGGFEQRLKELSVDDAPGAIPKTYVAGLEKDILFMSSPEYYLANCGREARVPNGFERLMTHELAHRLHARIVGGDENRMGPMWFWEGFATYAADQFPGNKSLTDAEVWQIVNSNSKDRGSYKKYNAVFTYFLQKKGVPLVEYVNRAGDPDFIAWLKEPSTTNSSK